MQLENRSSKNDSIQGTTCGHCGSAIPDGAALCPGCLTPQTAYAGGVTGTVSAQTKLKALKAAQRPAFVPVIVVYDLMLALVGPIGGIFRHLSARPTLNTETTNYIQTAFGAVGVFFALLLFIPTALFLLGLAWGAWTQKRPAWPLNCALMGAVAFLALIGIWPVGFTRIIVLLTSGAAAYLWLKPEVRGWYGY